MNEKAKGSRIRLKAKKEIESRGHICGIVERPSRFIKIKDLFGLFDLCYIDNDGVHFVQITCNKPHTHYKYQEFKKIHSFSDVFVEQWVHYDRKGFKKYLYTEDGYEILCN